MSDLVKKAEEAARAGGAVLLEWRGRINVREKGPSDLVTEADLASQDTIRCILMDAFPDHGFISEEAPTDRGQQPEYCWIVDPLDGTTNYVHGMRQFCVSVALERNGEVQAGCVFDPNSGECFTAARGHGAFVNGERLGTSATRELAQALVAVSFPPKVRADSVHIREFVRCLLQCRSVRRMGSAALNLCYLAAGRLDAFWARNIQAWDVAAGILFIEEAGGIVTGLDGEAFKLAQPPFIAASTRELHAALTRLVRAAELEETR